MKLPNPKKMYHKIDIKRPVYNTAEDEESRYSYVMDDNDSILKGYEDVYSGVYAQKMTQKYTETIRNQGSVYEGSVTYLIYNYGVDLDTDYIVLENNIEYNIISVTVYDNAYGIICKTK